MISEPVHGLLPQVCELLKKGELEQANKELVELLQQDLENSDVIYTLTGVNFWIDKLKKALTASTAFEQGEYLVSQWKPFTVFIKKQGREREPILYALKHSVFGLALRFYQSLYREDGTAQEPELYRKTGLCYKALGDYERALRLLEQAKDGDKDSPTILAELADCYALCGEVRLSKVLFREAFFQGASFVELHFLESEVILRLESQVHALGYSGSEMAEWIPVYGVLYGIFNIKRELRALEFGKLKQAIFALENELRDASAETRKILVPRLINHYFWLIDHYVNVNDDKARINEVLLKIKLLDTDVYNRYTM
ncbi:MAG TPA: tetratricopeptide repeat protein [Treponemataceae bacterium]|nr:tetratricopeptide repeat protein [Treponemataceae bacterium]